MQKRHFPAGKPNNLYPDVLVTKLKKRRYQTINIIDPIKRQVGKTEF